ncbi:pyridoxamine 5'-phosphate oxidase family protein [Candidatus Obscuribacterales bacterium]|jgi:general stress protein 26|nr:pyridoxamine 5'-phosphate oxidase family protein [Candidatus Obscuribacterales bacterium]MBX3138473.1 pyridoxamine 5'-phosphate oxidase family protein [Candidatus Obscuribacterales bacterium]MBX3149824.1 pyridoxamine 5'-phosphate oxidase family protein [Candidatus Obscuribacterales bacterium]
MKGKQQSRLHELLKDARVVMFSTIDNGVIRSRPMAIQRVDEDNTLWLLSEDKTAKIDEIQNYDAVNISFMDMKAQVYVSLSGTAEESRNLDKIRELWSLPLKAWFPDGPEQGVRVIQITPEIAEYWSTPSSAVMHAIGLTKALLNGEQYNDEAAEHVKVSGAATRI